MLLRLAYPQLISLSILLRPAFKDNSTPKFCVNIYVPYPSHIFSQWKHRALYLCLFVLARQRPVGQGLRFRTLPDNTQHSQQTDINAPPMGFEPTISAGEWPQTYALNRAANGPAVCLSWFHPFYRPRRPLGRVEV
jgi:hypothetical protein